MASGDDQSGRRKRARLIGLIPFFPFTRRLDASDRGLWRQNDETSCVYVPWSCLLTQAAGGMTLLQETTGVRRLRPSFGA